MTCVPEELSPVQSHIWKIRSIILLFLSLRASQNRLSWDGVFVCLCCSSCYHISVAGTYKKKSSWHFLLPVNARALMHVCWGLMTHTPWSPKQVLSTHYEDCKSGWHKAACCNRDSERAADCPGPEARRQLEGRLRMKSHLRKFHAQKYEQLLIQSSEFKSW